MNFDVSSLNKGFGIFANKIKDKLGENFFFNTNWYWDVLQTGQKVEPHPELGIGSLFDDIKSLQDMILGEVEPCPLDVHKVGILFKGFAYYLSVSSVGQSEEFVSISVEDIGKAVDLLLRRVENIEGASIELTDHWYWDIPLCEQFNITPSKPKLIKGHLAIDIESLSQIIEGSREPEIQDLVGCGQLFIAVGQKVESGVNIL